jgi:hypothetical protein
MLVFASSQALPFRDLERRLARRRLQQLDLRIRIELALIATLIAGFLFWQTRVPLDGLVRAHGAGIGTLAVAATVFAVLAIALPLTAVRHARRLELGPPGPEWLALPVAPRALAAHLAGESGGLALWLAVPAAAILAASFGLVPLAAVIAVAIAGAALLEGARRLGARIGLALAARRVRGGRGPVIERVLATAAPRARRRRLAPPAWRRLPVWRAIVEKDLRLTVRRPALGRAAVIFLLTWALSLGAWRLPAELALRHFVAFGLALLASAALAQWLVGHSGSDPFAGLRVLPVGLADVWGARVAWGVLGTVMIVAGHAIMARELAPHAMKVFLTWSGLASLGIAILGVNYGVTLFPRADVAERMLGLSLGLAMAASIMLPLSGWIVLLTAILHSARRLTHWSRLEETA